MEPAAAGRGPGSLLAIATDEVLDEIQSAAYFLRERAHFCVGGSLGRLPVKLAVSGAASGSGSGAAAGGRAKVVDLPAGSERDLGALLAECTPAVFGKGKKTVLDESYRSALALPAARIFTQHFEAAHLSGVLAAVGRLLLPAAGPLSARLHALNVYKKGGFFKPHRDTPRGDPGFVGSLVVGLPVAHAGGGLRIEQGRRSIVYDWGRGATAGEVQWAAFYPDCLHEVLPVTQGTRVALAYELFARPDTASGPPEPLRALPDVDAELLHVLRDALDSSSFMVNGGRLGFPCQHAYPQSLLQGVDQQAARAMMKGADGAVLHTLAALGVPCTIVCVWEMDMEMELPGMDFETEEEYEAAERALVVSKLAPLQMSKGPGAAAPRRREGELPLEVLREDTGADLDLSIHWLGGRDAFPEWTLGSIGQFFGNEGMYSQEFYCALAIVAEVPAFADRPSIQAASLAWAGRAPRRQELPKEGGRGGKGGKKQKKKRQRQEEQEEEEEEEELEEE